MASATRQRVHEPPLPRALWSREQLEALRPSSSSGPLWVAWLGAETLLTAVWLVAVLATFNVYSVLITLLYVMALIASTILAVGYNRRKLPRRAEARRTLAEFRYRPKDARFGYAVRVLMSLRRMHSSPEFHDVLARLATQLTHQFVALDDAREAVQHHQQMGIVDSDRRLQRLIDQREQALTSSLSQLEDLHVHALAANASGRTSQRDLERAVERITLRLQADVETNQIGELPKQPRAEATRQPREPARVEEVGR